MALIPKKCFMTCIRQQKHLLPLCSNFSTLRSLPIYSPNVSKRFRFKNSLLVQSSRNVIHSSQYPPVRIPNEDLFTFVTSNFNSFKNKLAAIDGMSGEQCTYDELLQSSVSLGSALIKYGLSPGDVVGIFSPNSIQFMITILGVCGAGGTLSPANHAFTAQELKQQMKASSAKFLITTAELHLTAEEAVAGTSIKIICIGDVKGSTAFDLLLEDDGSAFPSTSDRQTMINPKSHLAYIPFSSGTTGSPKGVMLTHYNMVATLTQTTSYEDLFGPSSNSDNRIMHVLPMWHIYALYSFLVSSRNGAMLLSLPRFEPVPFLESISKHKLTDLPIVPPLALFLTKHPIVSDHDLTSVREVVCAAASLKADLEDDIKHKFNIPIVRQGWGMSELVCGTLVPKGRSTNGSCGIIVPNTELKLVDVETQKELGHGETGEIALRGPQVMKGYLNNITATKETIDDEGWLYTGDIGYVDDNGHLFIVDRLKELIKYKGHQVAPAELEGILLNHPDVMDAGVVGIPDEVGGEVPRAYVQLKPSTNPSEDDIIQFVNKEINVFSWLRGGVEFVDAVPKSPSGKILRRELRQRYAEEYTKNTENECEKSVG